MVAAKIANLPVGANQHSGEVVTTGKASKILNVTLARAKQVVKGGAPELIEAVEADDLALSRAAEIAELPAAEQVGAIAQAKGARSKKNGVARSRKGATAGSENRSAAGGLPDDYYAGLRLPPDVSDDGVRAVEEALERLQKEHGVTVEFGRVRGIRKATWSGIRATEIDNSAPRPGVS
jgi:hypothetical protein